METLYSVQQAVHEKLTTFHMNSKVIYSEDVVNEIPRQLAFVDLQIGRKWSLKIPNKNDAYIFFLKAYIIFKHLYFSKMSYWIPLLYLHASLS